MKSPHCFSMLTFLLAVLFSSSLATSPHEDFLHCLPLRSNDSSSISNVIFTPHQSTFSSIFESTIRNLRFSASNTPKPLFIVTPSTTSHIQATIYCASRHGLQIRTRSGGHDFEGLSYVSRVPFIIVDLVNFGSVDVDVENRVALVQSGAVLGELYYRIAEKSSTLAFPAGTCHTVGTGGYFTGGGYGLLFRKYGLAADNIIDAQLIDVNERILDRKSMGEDLFWAIRGGGGGSFGIVLSWKLRLVSVPKTVTAFTITKTLEENAIKLVHRWQYIAHELPNGIYSSVTLNRVNRTVIASFSSLFLGDSNGLVSLMQERFPELGLVKQDCSEMSWIDSIRYFGLIQNEPLEILLDRNFKSPLTSPYYKAKSDYVKKPIPEMGLRGLWSMLTDEEAESAVFGFYAYGGIMDEIPETANPFPHRAGNLLKILYNVGWQEDDNVNSERYITWIRRVYDYMTSFVSKSPREAYINYRDLDIGTNYENGNTSYAEASIWGRKYFKNNFNRLVRVKTMIDPQNFFRHEQSIPPLLSSRNKRHH
ncbi:berberine bridge enzyme-like 18 [Hibiscus syriacus]|uniref:berberine bridge enzyme-like 18 n=1 Tax=Hibiscus syriacus TaxID=106335 RepID=UPI00192488AF|nr:berberine bridge enzyme-like 18 [Hibiscus syriacus]